MVYSPYAPLLEFHVNQAKIILDFIKALDMPATKSTRDMVDKLPVAVSGQYGTYADRWTMADGSVLVFSHEANAGYEWSHS